jgi:uncharacterized membrane protein
MKYAIKHALLVLLLLPLPACMSTAPASLQPQIALDEVGVNRAVSCSTQQIKTEWGTYVTELTAEVAAPPEAVWAVLTDYANYPRFVPGAKSYDIVESKDNVTYVSSKGFRIKELWANLKFTADKENLTVEWLRVTSNVSLNRGVWELKPLIIDGNRFTSVVHRIYTEPSMLESMFNMIQHVEEDESEIVRNVRNIAEGK